MDRTVHKSKSRSEALPWDMEAGVTQALGGRWDEYRTAMLEGDPEGILACWTEDMRLWGPGMNLERTEFEAVVSGYFEPGTVITAIEVTPVDTFIHGDVVYQIGQMDETIQYPGGEPMEASYHILAKWEKQPDGVWRMSRGLQSPVDAPPEGQTKPSVRFGVPNSQKIKKDSSLGSRLGGDSLHGSPDLSERC